MIKEINIGNQKTTLEALQSIKNNKRVSGDIRLLNSHITSINKLVGIRIFKNNTLYINAETLWDLMHEESGKRSHNYHGLTPEDIYMAFVSIKEPKYVLIAKYGRYSLITMQLSHFEEPLLILIDPNSGLYTERFATINKIITIYPKSDVKKYINGLCKNKILL